MATNITFQKRPGIGLENIPNIQPATAPLDNLNQIQRSASRDAAQLQETSEKLYLTNFEVEARKSINEISQKNQANPEQLAQELDASFEGFSQNAPGFLKEQLRMRYEILKQPAINSAVQTRTRINNDKLKESSLISINQSFKGLEQNAAAMLSDDPHMAYDASRAAQLEMLTIANMAQQVDESGIPLFSAEKRVALNEQAKQSVVGAGIRGWFDSQPNKERAYKQFLDGKKTFKLYDANGKLDVEINPLFEMDRGTFERTRNYMERAVDEQRKEVQKVNEFNQFKNFLDSDNLVIDPKDKKQRDIADQYFVENIASQLANANDNTKVEVISDYVRKTGIIPTPILSNIRGTLRNGNIQQQTIASNLISRLQEVNPAALADLSGSDISYGLMLSKSIRAGLKPEEAIRYAKDNFDPLKEDLIKRRREDFRFQGIRSDIELRKIFQRPRLWVLGNKTLLPEVPNVSEQASIEYLNHLEREYVRTGDMDVAKKTAGELMARQWGVTEVTGKNYIMKYAPEAYYSVSGLDNKWMSEQLLEAVKTMKPDVELNDIALVADVVTAGEAETTREPTYMVMVKNKDGSYDPIHQDNTMKRFKFDANQAAQKHNKEKQESNRKPMDVYNMRADFKQRLKEEIDQRSDREKGL